ncbi:hypothetical protein ACLOJK_017355 [Asimina triloba]
MDNFSSSMKGNPNFLYQEVAFKTLAGFFKEESLKYFVPKKKFFSWCRVINLYNPSRLARPLALKSISKRSVKEKPLESDVASERFVLIIQEVVELKVYEKGRKGVSKRPLI